MNEKVIAHNDEEAVELMKTHIPTCPECGHKAIGSNFRGKDLGGKSDDERRAWLCGDMGHVAFPVESIIWKSKAELQKGISNGTEPSEFELTIPANREEGERNIYKAIIDDLEEAMFSVYQNCHAAKVEAENECCVLRGEIDRLNKRIAELEGEQDNLKELYDKLHIDFVNRGLKIQELESENAKDKG